MTDPISSKFDSLVNEITVIGLEYHLTSLDDHVQANIPYVKKSIKDLPPPTSDTGIVISAGPSLQRQNSLQKIVDSGYSKITISTDGSYIASIKKGIVPEYVLTLDPHPTRIVRWFGDPDIQKNLENDDYFERQDLNVDFRTNTLKQNEENIRIVNENAGKTKAIVATTVHPSVTKRLIEAGFDIYWWHPLVDDPNKPDSLTRNFYQKIKLPCLNTGGTVGTTSWLFAELILKLKNIAVIGMDYGYYDDLPIEKTQTYYELVMKEGKEGVEQYFVPHKNSLTGQGFYIDPTYYWYRRNFYELLERSEATLINCTEGGTLEHPQIKNINFTEFLTQHK
ncbi:hypothetical protein LPTSP4_03200 [Leptospira ryugenii]|uniref:6-hydroxymethylpterin diphosphokinase MptE-like domain-containing protein n=1 Tax=Leptospira ryugenii TaxID=1917863 RepID=A0A2P2DW78_9LEPT|nr:6-hydroxymethylpterin diphosphokinase MptE-like protein [Leptospira ryugenii]GBF48820.1 hypothetical protein LPTSP4_03200 [Leptospira ryugenii]